MWRSQSKATAWPQMEVSDSPLRSTKAMASFLVVWWMKYSTTPVWRSPLWKMIVSWCTQLVQLSIRSYILTVKHSTFSASVHGFTFSLFLFTGPSFTLESNSVSITLGGFTVDTVSELILLHITIHDVYMYCSGCGVCTLACMYVTILPGIVTCINTQFTAEIEQEFRMTTADVVNGYCRTQVCQMINISRR